MARWPTFVRSNSLRRGVAFLALLASTIATARCQAPEEKDKPLPPQTVSLKTSDDVTLSATYYPSKLGRSAVPVILIHAHRGDRRDFEELARQLQRAGHAVMAPDLRGHGESKDAAERLTELKAADLAEMVRYDLETVKRFLVDKNNAGELNIEQLGVVGVEMGATLGLNWAARDWSWERLPNVKQGQDVKAIALVSPEWSYKGLRINDAVAQANFRSAVSMLIIAGKGNARSLKEAKRLYAALEKYQAVDGDKQTLWLRTPQTSLQGTRLLKEDDVRVDEMILKFIELRLVNQPQPWSVRKSPLD